MERAIDSGARLLRNCRRLGSVELERMVQDAGLTFGDVLELAKQSGDSASLLYRRLEQAGIDFRVMDPAVLRDMQRCCSFCDSKSQCATNSRTSRRRQAGRNIVPTG